MSLMVRSREGWERRVSEQRVCMWEMAMCSAVLPSESWREEQGDRQTLYIAKRLYTVDKRWEARLNEPERVESETWLVS